MYCYTVMGQGLTGGTQGCSWYRDLAFSNIPESIGEDGKPIPGFPAIIGDHGDVAFDGMIDDTYGSAKTFENMFDLLLYVFFPRCTWAPMYLEGPKCYFFERSLGLLALEAGEEGIWPSLRKWTMMPQWPTPTTCEDVQAFCYLTPFLRRFIPGRAELVRIMTKAMELEVVGEHDVGEQNGGDLGRKELEAKREGKRKAKGENTGKKPRKVEGPFVWTDEYECAFQAIKQAIATNAMAPSDPDLQYHLAADASKWGIGGVLFQLENIKAYSQATDREAHQAAEHLITFLSFRLEDAETRYSNSEWEALAVVRCWAEVKWMVMASLYPTLVYTDHEAPKVLLTGPDNNSHGCIAKWQEQLGEYDFQLLHRAVGTHFMGIADGLSLLPTSLMQRAFVEDSGGLWPHLTACGTITAGHLGIDSKTLATAQLAISFRNALHPWLQRAAIGRQKPQGKNHGAIKGAEREGCGRRGRPLFWCRRWKVGALKGRLD